MIVKVQASLATNDPRGQLALIYNEDRTVEWCGPVSDEILAQLKGEPKAFFYAFLDDKGVIQIKNPAPWQEW